MKSYAEGQAGQLGDNGPAVRSGRCMLAGAEWLKNL